MFVVTVTSHIKPGHLEAFLEACRQLRPKVLAEEGCLFYEFARPVPFPLDSDADVETDCVVLTEIWENEAALRKHAGVPHGKAFAQQVRHMRESVTVSAASSAL